jgi:hypothetical protein
MPVTITFTEDEYRILEGILPLVRQLIEIVPDEEDYARLGEMEEKVSDARQIKPWRDR